MLSQSKAKRELVDVRNQGEALMYTAEKALKDAGEKVPAEVRKTIEDKISDLKTANKGDDAAQIKTATEALSNEIQKIAQYMTQANNQSPNTNNQPPKDDKGPEGPNPSDGQGNVRDAETK